MEQTTAAFKRIEKALGTDDTFKLPITYGDLNRQELLLEGLRAGKITFQDGVEHKHKVFEHITRRSLRIICYTALSCLSFEAGVSLCYYSAIAPT